MRRNALTVGIAAMALALTAACGSNDAPSVGGPATTAAPTPSATTPATSSATSSSATSTTTTSSAPATFTAGQCLDAKPSYAPVDCSTPHSFEVAAVVPSTAHAGDLIKRSAFGNASCNLAGATYLGSQAWTVTRLRIDLMPTSADPSSGSRFVCIASELDPTLKTLGKPTHSLKGKLAGNGFSPYAVCLKGRASTSDGVEVVPCTQPHASEAVGGKLNGKPDQAFPGNKVIQPAALKYCTPVGQTFLGTKARRDVIVSQNSGGAGPWSKGQMVTGCFVEVTSGTVTKSLRGIGVNKPLSSYR